MRDAANVFVCARVLLSFSLSFSFSTRVFFIWWFGIVRKVLSTSRSKMLPDNYSGSKFDNRKPSVKRSARHHHQQQRQRQQRDRFLLCTAVHSLRSRGERERERENTKQRQRKKKKKTNDSIQVLKKGTETKSLFFLHERHERTNRKKKKKKNEGSKRRRVCSLFLFLPLFRTAFFGVACNRACKCEWGSPFFVSSHPSKEKKCFEASKCL